MYHFNLNFSRKAATQTVWVNYLVLGIFRFKHNMMLSGGCEADDFIFNRRTVAHARTDYLAAIKGGRCQIRSNYFVCFFRRMS